MPVLPPSRSPSLRAGFGIIGLLLTVLILGLSAGLVLPMLKPRGRAGNGPANPMERSWDAVCAVNKQQIAQAIQLYNINHEPMKKLDLKALSLHISTPPNCPCSYSLDLNGRVVCKEHK